MRCNLSRVVFASSIPLPLEGGVLEAERVFIDINPRNYVRYRTATPDVTPTAATRSTVSQCRMARKTFEAQYLAQLAKFSADTMSMWERESLAAEATLKQQRSRKLSRKRPRLSKINNRGAS